MALELRAAESRESVGTLLAGRQQRTQVHGFAAAEVAADSVAMVREVCRYEKV